MATDTITTTNDAGRCPCTPEAHQRAVLDPEVLKAFEIMGIDPDAPRSTRAMAEVEESIAGKLLELNRSKGIVLYGNEFELEV